MSNQTNKKAPGNRGDNEEKEINMSLRSIWLGMRDSNPRSWDQNPVPYRLANPQYNLYFTVLRWYDNLNLTNVDIARVEADRFDQPNCHILC